MGMLKASVGGLVAWMWVAYVSLGGAGSALTGADGNAGQIETLMLRGGPGVANHPVQVVPSTDITIPDGWPLDSQGRITCVTCHAAIPLTRGEASAPLRDSDPVESDSITPDIFCGNCHSLHDGSNARAVHWTAIRVAHVKSGSKPDERSLGLLDADSSLCLACHDGVNASESQNTTLWNRSVAGTRIVAVNHPIGIRYPFPGAKTSGPAFRPAAMLPKEIPLPGGKVGCLSCHNLFGQEPYRLNIPIEGSALCFACHDMN